MATYFAIKLTATCSPMIGQILDTMILASSDIEWSIMTLAIKAYFLENAGNYPFLDSFLCNFL